MNNSSEKFLYSLLDRRWLRWFGFGVVLIIVFLQFRTYGQDFQHISKISRPAQLFLAIPIVLITLVLHAANWGSILKTLGNQLRFLDVLFIYFYSSLARYLPGTYWYIVTRTAMGAKSGQPPANTLFGIGLELGVKVFAGLTVLLAAYLYGIKLQMNQLIWIGAWLLLGGFLFLLINLSRKKIHRSQNVSSWLNTFQKLFLMLRTKPLVIGKWYFFYLVAWMIQGIGLWLILNAWQPLNMRTIIWTIFAYAAGWIAGFLNPFTPSGLGAREAVLMAILAPIVSAPTALEASIVMRLTILIGESILTVISWSGLKIEIWLERDKSAEKKSTN